MTDFDIRALIGEFKKLQIFEWKNDTFQDILRPWEENDWNTLAEAIEKRESFVKEIKPQFKPRQAFGILLSKARANAKEMSSGKKDSKGKSGQVQAVAYRKAGERGMHNTDMAVQGTEAPRTSRVQQPNQALQSKENSPKWRYDVLSKAVYGLQRAVELRSFDSIDFQCPETKSEELKKDFEALDKIRNDLEIRKAVCDWLSSGIEDLKLAAEKDEYEYDIRKDKPSKVTRTADNLEFIQKKLKETLQKQCDNQTMLKNWLEHIHQLLTSTSSEPPPFVLNKSVLGASTDMMTCITTSLWKCVLQTRTLEAERDELMADMERCCNKLLSVKETHDETSMKMKTNSDLKSTMAMLNEKTTELKARLKETEKELETVRDTNKRLTEEKDKMPKSKKTGEESEQKLVALQKQVDEYKTAIDSLNSLCKDEAGASSTPSKKEKLQATKGEKGKLGAQVTVQMVQRKLSESAQEISTLQQEQDVYKQTFNSIHDLFKDEVKSTTIQNKNKQPKKLNTGTPVSHETAQIVLDKVEKLKAEYKQLSQEVASCRAEIEKIGLTTNESATNSQLNKEDGDMSLTQAVGKVKDRMDDIKESLKDEVSQCKKQNQDGREQFKIIQDVCQQLLGQEKPKSGKRRNENTGREHGKDIRNVVEMGEDAVQMVMGLTDKHEKLEQTTKRHEEEISQLKKEIQEADANVSELRHRLSRCMGADLMVDNPNIADLSDTNRPTKLAESFSELYDNEWTNAFEELKQKKKGEDVDIVKSLLDLLKFAFDYCSETAQSQMRGLIVHICTPAILQIENSEKDSSVKETDSASKQTLIDLRKKTFAVASAHMTQHSVEIMKRKNIWDEAYNSKSCQKYIKSCIDICWLMAIQSPPMYLDFEIDKKSKFDDKKYKAYLKTGKKIDFMVWPPIYLTKGGNLLAKGVVEGKR